MIFYFSATGNSKYVARRIGEVLKESLVPIPDCMDSDTHDFYLTGNEAVGIVTPTYALRLPHIVEQFLKLLRIHTEPGTKHYIFMVSTYGTSPGLTEDHVRRLIEKRGLALNASFGVKMPDTWTPVFDLSNPVRIQEINDHAETMISDILARIEKEEEGSFQTRRPPRITDGISMRFYEKMRRTDAFAVDTDACVHCALCADHCPVHAIRMKNGFPVWIKSRCEACLMCLHRCPKFAIRYGKRTPKHGQYRNPHEDLSGS